MKVMKTGKNSLKRAAKWYFETCAVCYSSEWVSPKN